MNRHKIENPDLRQEPKTKSKKRRYIIVGSVIFVLLCLMYVLLIFGDTFEVISANIYMMSNHFGEYQYVSSQIIYGENSHMKDHVQVTFDVGYPPGRQILVLKNIKVVDGWTQWRSDSGHDTVN